MSNEFNIIAILGRHEDPRVAEPMAELVAYLTKAGAEVIAVPEVPDKLRVRRVPEEEIAGLADLIVAVGQTGNFFLWYVARK